MEARGSIVEPEGQIFDVTYGLPLRRSGESVQHGFLLSRTVVRTGERSPGVLWLTHGEKHAIATAHLPPAPILLSKL